MTELRCADVEARFVDAADGRLDPAESVRFHSHIEGCAACRERALAWTALIPGLRAAVPPPPDAMTTRRMQIEIERQVARRAAPAPARRWRAWWIPAAGLATAAAAVVLWMRAGHAPPATPIGYAAIQTLRGAVTVGDRASAVAAARVPVGQPIVLHPDAVAQLALDSGAVVRAQGPARLTFEGSARDVAIRLVSGKLEAEVTHRRENETFAVVTGDLRVVVRGTKFSVAAATSGSRVEVSEGRVSVELAGGRTTMVSAGESFDSRADDSELAPQAVVIRAAPPADCAEITRSCQTAARTARATMRGGDAERALRIVTEARRAGGNDVDAGCGGGARACEDELRYLHAEALNQAGRLDDAATAYHALDRKGAPSAMRQNALFAAAQIEKRTGRLTAASADFERALVAAPRGALYEEALVGAMETAGAAGDGARARAFAARYLGEFPRGLAATAARRFAGARP